MECVATLVTQLVLTRVERATVNGMYLGHSFRLEYLHSRNDCLNLVMTNEGENKNEINDCTSRNTE